MTTTIRAVILAGLALLLTAPAAHADGFPPVIGGGGTEPGTPGGGTSAGGQSSPTPAPKGTYWVYGGTSLTEEAWSWNEGPGSLQLPTPGGTNVSGHCKPGTVNGEKDWFATSASWSFLLNEDDDSWAGSYGWTCNIPPTPQDATVRCVERMHAVITQELDPANRRTLRNKTITTPWASDRTNPVKCGQSVTIKVQAEMDRLGGYLVDITGKSFPCTQRSYPGTSRPSRIVRCGSAATTSKSLKGGLWCGNGGVAWALGDSSWDHNFTWASCADESEDLIDCQLNSRAPRLAGHLADNNTDPAQVLDDGTARALRFAPLKPTGPIVSLSNITTTLRVDKDSSPYRVGERVDGDTQPFTAKEGFAVSAGDTSTWHTAFYAAGVAGQPWTARKVSTFDARVRIRTVTIQQIDFNTMDVVTTEKSTVVSADGVSCQSPNAYVAVYRARNSS